MLVALSATILISMARLVALLTPVRAVVRDFAAFPMRAAFAVKVVSEPLEAALVSAESFGSLARSNRASLAASFARVSCSLVSASLGAVCPFGNEGWRDREYLTASWARFFDLVRVCFASTYLRTKYLTLHS